jgi:hypothetical protein
MSYQILARRNIQILANIWEMLTDTLRGMSMGIRQVLRDVDLQLCTSQHSIQNSKDLPLDAHQQIN